LFAALCICGRGKTLNKFDFRDVDEFSLKECDGDNTMNYSAILTDDYADILDVAQVSPIHGFDGREEYDFFFDETLPADAVIWEHGEYTIADVGYDSPTVMLFHAGKVVGFYFDMMAWLDADHRGMGLATKMIFAYADRFGENAFREQRIKADCALGFSPEGFDLHQRALELAREMAQAANPKKTPSL
jgi:RimJ/RimL family protein N-acetyltransferase